MVEPVALDLADPDDPLQVAEAYSAAGADELFVACRDASLDRLAATTRRLGASLCLPVTVHADAGQPEALVPLLNAGASRVAIESAALRDPDAIARLATTFGSETIAVVIRTRAENGLWRVLEGPEQPPTEWQVVTWARVIEAQGAGEVVLDTGTRDMRDLDALNLMELVTQALNRPVSVASDPATRDDVFDAFMIGGADAVLLDSLVHTARESLTDLKHFLAAHGLAVRPR